MTKPKGVLTLGHNLHLDLATVLGIIGAFLLIISALVMGGTPSAFFNPPSVLIVLGGTVCVTMACFSMGEVFKTGAIVKNAIFYRLDHPTDIAQKILKTAEFVRTNSLLGMQSEILPSMTNYRPFHEGLLLLVDGASQDDAIEQAEIITASIHKQNTDAAGIMRKAAEVSPAMGLIGTLIGLVQMLGTMDDPSSIGPAMAVALLTTFYGVVLANVVFNPLAAKLEKNGNDELTINRMFMVGIKAIAKQENPRRTEMTLNSILPPSMRIRYYD